MGGKLSPLPPARPYFYRSSMILIPFFLLALAYCMLMMVYRAGWKLQPEFDATAGSRQATSIAVIIPSRNESANIEACIRSVLAQSYPQELLRIVVVDDHSDDDTALRAAACGSRVQVISLAAISGRGGKKVALAAGIAASNGSLIVTTDADCIAGPDWLAQIAALYESRPTAMIIGPVRFSAPQNLVTLFQSIDFTTMQGITAAAQRLGLGGMANGANLAFSREAFDAVGGYEGIDHLASGDDFLLLHKMKQRFPDRIHYLKSKAAIIETAPQPDWKSFLHQRIRWASKSGKYPDYRLTAVLLLVYLFNLSLAVLTLRCLFGHPYLWPTLFAILAAKTIAELIFLLPVWQFYRAGSGLWLFPLLQPLHILYIILAGFFGLLGDYQWKGRQLT